MGRTNGNMLTRFLVILLIRAIGLFAYNTCGGPTSNTFCKDANSPMCCYGTCCPTDVYRTFPFTSCRNSDGVQRCENYHMTSCCPTKSGTVNLGHTCCKHTASTLTSCPGASYTDYCTKRSVTSCCYSKCCSQWDYSHFRFSVCSGRHPVGYTSRTCLSHPNTHCCTLTHQSQPKTRYSSVFCCSSKYVTTYRTYASCAWSGMTKYCTDPSSTSCCRGLCCATQTYRTCGLYQTQWPTQICSEYPSTNCCYKESHGNIVGETCCTASPTVPEMSDEEPPQTGPANAIGFSIGMIVIIVVTTAAWAGHAVAKRRRRLRRQMCHPDDPTSTGMDAGPPAYDTLPPSYDQLPASIQHPPAPRYDQALQRDQLPPSYSFVVNHGLAVTPSDVHIVNGGVSDVNANGITRGVDTHFNTHGVNTNGNTMTGDGANFVTNGKTTVVDTIFDICGVNTNGNITGVNTNGNNTGGDTNFDTSGVNTNGNGVNANGNTNDNGGALASYESTSSNV